MGAIFGVGMIPEAEMLSFKAVYRDLTGTHVISGKAVVTVQPMDGIMGIIVILFRSDALNLTQESQLVQVAIRKITEGYAYSELNFLPRRIKSKANDFKRALVGCNTPLILIFP